MLMSLSPLTVYKVLDSRLLAVCQTPLNPKNIMFGHQYLTLTSDRGRVHSGLRRSPLEDRPVRLLPLPARHLAVFAALPEERAGLHTLH